MMENTISQTISCSGIAIHSGQETNLTLHPADEGCGVVFVRTDVIGKDNAIIASYDKVYDTTLCTSIANQAKTNICTIEHLMAAIWGMGIDNLLIEVNGPEIPIMDGSSKDFVSLIQAAGVKQQKGRRRYLKLLKPIMISDNSSEITATPSANLSIDVSIDFESAAIGKQAHRIIDRNMFSEISAARTFGFVEEIEYLKSKGLAKGASLDNAIGIGNDKVMNPEGLRYDNEFARHKLLDLCGDFALLGGVQIIADIKAHKPSHSINNKFLRFLSENPSFYEFV